MTEVACIGECMIALRERADGRFSRGFGGDTLNTAVYLTRSGVSVDYVSALGDDPFSESMIAAWRDEGVCVTKVIRVEGALPGLYLIQTDARGERAFPIGDSRRRSEGCSIFPSSPPSQIPGRIIG
jgi:2-dehydro-3-deoxygluconokinase